MLARVSGVETFLKCGSVEWECSRAAGPCHISICEREIAPICVALVPVWLPTKLFGSVVPSTLILGRRGVLSSLVPPWVTLVGGLTREMASGTEGLGKDVEDKLAVGTAPAEAKPAPEEKPHPSGLTLEERYQLCRSVGEECQTEDELRRLMNKPMPIAYDGFEPSGRMHIAQGVMKAINVNKLTKAGVHFKFWVADWFAQLNNKMGGDLKKIQTVGRYMVEVWKAVGMDLSKVEFLSSSEEINKRPDEYWTLVMDIARKSTLNRIIRCARAHLSMHACMHSGWMVHAWRMRARCVHQCTHRALTKQEGYIEKHA